MSSLKTYTRKDLDRYTNKRAGEEKFGEVAGIFSSWEALEKDTSKYVIIGIPEAIGVRANYGREGTQNAWHSTLHGLCNIQQNEFINAEKVVILGEIDCDTQNKQAETILKEDPHAAEKLGELVSQIDHKVSEIVQKIVSCNKIPIIIGGGHNNSYGNLKGASEALGTAINCINFDAHTDFRALEHRHSGNGFSYAFEEGYLDRYFIFGLHRNYTSQAIFNTLQKEKERIDFNLFETISVKKTLSFTEAIQQAETFCCDTAFGLELDMDAIEAMGSSAMSPSGFSIAETRHFLQHFSNHQNCTYIHICEGNPELELFPKQIAKTISYLISDVISI